MSASEVRSSKKLKVETQGSRTSVQVSARYPVVYSRSSASGQWNYCITVSLGAFIKIDLSAQPPT